MIFKHRKTPGAQSLYQHFGNSDSRKSCSPTRLVPELREFLLGKTNFDQMLTPELCTQAKLAVKNEYTFNFLEIGDKHEQELKRVLIAKPEEIAALQEGYKWRKIAHREFYPDSGGNGNNSCTFALLNQRNLHER